MQDNSQRVHRGSHRIHRQLELHRCIIVQGALVQESSQRESTEQATPYEESPDDDGGLTHSNRDEGIENRVHLCKRVHRQSTESAEQANPRQESPDDDGGLKNGNLDEATETRVH